MELNYIILINNMIALFTYLLLCISTSTQSTQTKGVQIINKLKPALQQHDRVIVLFSDSHSQQCQHFTQIYTLLAQKYSDEAHFARIQYKDQTKQTFQQLHVTVVPLVLAFQQQKWLSYPFQGLGTDQTLPVHFQRWIQRLWDRLPQYDRLNTYEHKLVVGCDSLSNFWKQIRRSELWLQVQCGSSDILGSRSVLVQANGQKEQEWQIDGGQVEDSLRSKIKALKYKHVVIWNDQIAQEIFAKNNSAYILIVNNDSQSRQVFSQYQQLKREWNKQPSIYKPTLFSVADLVTNTQDTTRIKRYLLRGNVTKSRTYSYPILAFLKPSGEKYVCRWQEGKTQNQLRKFIKQVHQQVIMGNKDSRHPLKPWLSEDYSSEEMIKNREEDKKKLLQNLLNQKKQHFQARQVYDKMRNKHKGQSNKHKTEGGKDKDQNQNKKDQYSALSYKKTKSKTKKQGDHSIKSIRNFLQWQQLLDPANNTLGVFVYFTWRNNYYLQELQNELKKWWSSAGEAFEQNTVPSIKTFLVNYNDLPPQLPLQYLPTIVYISPDKSIQKLEGVTDLQAIKDFRHKHSPLHAPK